jgi:hypothetical protein
VIGRFRTIRVRLMLGFGLVIIALFGAGVVGIQALDSLQDGLRDRIGEVATVGDRLFLSHDATLRTVALAQADLMAGQGGSRAKIDSLTQLSDSIRRLVVTESALGTAERQRLEEIGALQARIDVRLSVARAYRDVGRVDDAFRMANLATLTLDTLLTESAALSADQVDRTAVTVAAVEELVAARRRLLSSDSLPPWRLGTRRGGRSPARSTASCTPPARWDRDTYWSTTRPSNSTRSTRWWPTRWRKRPRICAPSCSRFRTRHASRRRPRRGCAGPRARRPARVAS